MEIKNKTIQEAIKNKQTNFHRATVFSALSLFFVALFNTSFFFDLAYQGERTTYVGLLLMATAVTTFVFSVKALQKKLLVVITLLIYTLIAALAFMQGFLAFVASALRGVG